VPEYGSAEDPKQFEYLYAYSPYHHVQPLFQYPAIMFVTGDSDTRVAPLHARKMAALMQANSSVNSPVLLHYDVKSGHSDGKPIDQTVEDTADEVLFLLNNLGV
jgi:prolyl oligopeptidase